MANYQLLNVESTVLPVSVFEQKTFIDINFDVSTEERKDSYSGKTVLFYVYKSIRIRNGKPNKVELQDFLIQNEYSIQKQLNLMIEQNEEYQVFLNRRQELLDLANSLYEQYNPTPVVEKLRLVENPDISVSHEFKCSFISNDNEFTGITIDANNFLYYMKGDAQFGAYDGKYWKTDEYRVLKLLEEPGNDFASWLKENRE